MILVMTDGAPIGIRIARRRQALGMRQEDLARKLGVSKSSVANWESGKHFPKRKQGAVEQVLGISLDDTPEPESEPAWLTDLRRRIYDELPPDRAAKVEAAVEAAMEGEPKRRAGSA